MRQLLRRLVSRLYAERDRIVRRRLGAAGDRLEWVALDVRRAPVSDRNTRPHFVQPEELRAAPERYWFERAAVERMLAGGDRCLAVRVGDECVYRANVMSDRERVSEVLRPFGVGERAWIVSGVMTHPAHRGRHLHAAAMAWLAAEARRAGAEHLVAWVARWNRSSHRAFARAGFLPLRPPADVGHRPAMD